MTKEQLKGYQAKYYQKNREEILSRNRPNVDKWHAEHKEHIRAYQKQYREQHREELREYKRKYYQEHKITMDAASNTKLNVLKKYGY